MAPLPRSLSVPPSFAPTYDDLALTHAKQPTDEQETSDPLPPSRRFLLVDGTENVYTDAVIAIDERTLAEITAGDKDYEFRRYLIDNQVRYIWLYVKNPVGAITYDKLWLPPMRADTNPQQTCYTDIYSEETG